jgi:hypothetical protein
MLKSWYSLLHVYIKMSDTNLAFPTKSFPHLFQIHQLLANKKKEGLQKRFWQKLCFSLKEMAHNLQDKIPRSIHAYNLKKKIKILKIVSKNQRSLFFFKYFKTFLKLLEKKRKIIYPHSAS